MVLAGLEGPLEALFAHLTATADLLGLLDLEDGRSGVADGEEQLRVLIEAGRAVAPIHGFRRTHFHTGETSWRADVNAFTSASSTVARIASGDNPFRWSVLSQAPARVDPASTHRYPAGRAVTCRPCTTTTAGPFRRPSWSQRAWRDSRGSWC